MSKRTYINQIRQIINNPPTPEPDLSHWTDEDLRTFIAIANRNGVKGVFNKENTIPEDLETINKMLRHYQHTG